MAAEFPAFTNYLYLTYNGEEHDADLATTEGHKHGGGSIGNDDMELVLGRWGGSRAVQHGELLVRTHTMGELPIAERTDRGRSRAQDLPQPRLPGMDSANYQGGLPYRYWGRLSAAM